MLDPQSGKYYLSLTSDSKVKHQWDDHPIDGQGPVKGTSYASFKRIVQHLLLDHKWLV